VGELRFPGKLEELGRRLKDVFASFRGYRCVFEVDEACPLEAVEDRFCRLDLLGGGPVEEFGKVDELRGGVAD